MSAGTTFPNPPRLTFGVEFEFLVAYLVHTKPDPLESVEDLPPVNRTPVDMFELAPTLIYKQLVSLLEDHSINSNTEESGIEVSEFKNKYDEAAFGEYTQWRVKWDASIQEDDRETFDYVGIELVTPVLLDTPVSFETIDYVRELIMKTFRVRVNPSCGLHVHVGNRTERFPLESAKRIASLVWATEHLLVTLNSPDRQVHWYTQTLRNWSNISNGNFECSGPSERERFLGGDTPRYGEMPISWRDQHCTPDIIQAFAKTRLKGHFEPFWWADPDNAPSAEKTGGAKSPLESSWGTEFEETEPTESVKATQSAAPLDKLLKSVEPGDSFLIRPTESELGSSSELNDPARMRTIPRIARPRYTLQQLLERQDRLVEYGGGGLDLEEGRRKDPGVFEGVRHILAATNVTQIAHLVSTSGRGMTDFSAFRNDAIDRPDDRRTIEFRAAEGTLGPWATTWARICVGLVRFALYARPEVFADVLRSCDRSTDEDGVYDAIDLLNDLGLYAEAAIAEQRIVEHKDEWGLEYVPESS
ncbi:putative amidoligase enzyme-domain-containing protein [Hypomontagnella submonticulosa]|nr:putative amidoligase enzyme-domain-containing protein [Hypomontagnella submonticulosa]